MKWNHIFTKGLNFLLSGRIFRPFWLENFGESWQHWSVCEYKLLTRQHKICLTAQDCTLFLSCLVQLVLYGMQSLATDEIHTFF